MLAGGLGLSALTTGLSLRGQPTRALAAVRQTTPIATPVLGNSPFGLGVASGDPLPDAVVLWTRLAVDPLAEDGLGGMDPVPVEVGWDVAVLSLKQGTCDIFASSLIYNAPRAMEINYVRPFLAKGINVVIQKANPKNLKEPSDLNNSAVTVVAQLGSREQETVQRLYPKAKILAVRANSQLELVEQVKRGDADAAALPAITVKWWLQVPENAAWGMEGFPGRDFGNAPAGW